MRAGEVTASAPTRIDLAGGTLDLWPISVLVPGALTLNLALDLRAHVRIAPRRDRRVVIVSRDRRRRVQLRLPLDFRRADGSLGLLTRLVAAFAPPRGLELETRAEAPAGAGLGGSSTLGVATAAALARFCGVRLGGERLLRRVVNLETVELGVPAGNQDHLAAWHGGLSAFWHGPDGVRHERIPIPDELESRLVLAYSGQPRRSGFSNWDMFRRFVDGERRTVRAMHDIATIAREMRDALVAGELDAAGRLLGAEGRLRFRLAPSVSTPALRRAAAAARAAGALGSKVCGAGGGGCFVAYARAGSRDRIERALVAAGARILEPKISPAGVRVSGPRARA